MRTRFVLAAALSFPTLTFAQAKPATVAQANAWMQKTEADLLAVVNDAGHAQWVGETYINEDSEHITAKANERLLARVNNAIKEGRRFEKLQGLSPEWKRKYMLLKLQGSPTDPKLLAELTQTAAQLDGMYGKGKYCLHGDSNNCKGVDELGVMMAKSRDPKELLDIWIGWHKIGAPMREKYARLAELSNEGAREFGFKDTGEQWRAGYDMSPAEFSAELDRVWTQLAPFYKELHAYVRTKLIEKYGDAARRPDGMIPAHLLGNMWAQEWGNIYDIVAPPKAAATPDLEEALKKQIAQTTPEAADLVLDHCKGKPCEVESSDAAEAARIAAAKAMVKYGERFYTSMGFDPLPKTFWERSQFAKPRDREVVCHASAWDVDNDLDLRVKLCLGVNADDFTTLHHELGHNIYQRAYRHQPFLFRNGANDGFHEAIGDSIALAITPEYLKELKLIDKVPPADADIPLQLRTAMDKIAFLPFGLLIDQWRWKVFSGEVKSADYNKAWWQLREKYQGIAPPVTRSEADFDPGAKYHIPGNVPYTRYFLARVYQFQFYKAMCDASGYKGPLNRCTFYGSKAAGDKLNAMMEKGQSQPWQKTLKEMTGSDHIDAGPMLEYFAPLYTWLKEQNAKSEAKVGWTVE